MVNILNAAWWLFKDSEPQPIEQPVEMLPLPCIAFLVLAFVIVCYLYFYVFDGEEQDG